VTTPVITWLLDHVGIGGEAMTGRGAGDPPESTPHGVGAGQPIPEYLLRSLPELRALPDWAAYLAWPCGL
jgi:hypothetical protein